MDQRIPVQSVGDGGKRENTQTGFNRMHEAYIEVADFIAVNNPRGVIAFRPSSEARARLADLIAREKSDGLSAEDRLELDYCILVESLMRLAKARAHQHLQVGSLG